jgi:hypothetical protein
MIEGFLLGVIATASLVAAAFFFKGLNRIAIVLFVAQPNEGRPEVYLVRLFALLLVAAAIVSKNRKDPG